jgi:predicted signal transduction protein with EAL and GGDEF domain
MVQAIIHLARALGLKTIAEGVEDEQTAALLTTLGADYLQGYHFAKPMPKGEFEAWLSHTASTLHGHDVPPERWQKALDPAVADASQTQARALPGA